MSFLGIHAGVRGDIARGLLSGFHPCCIAYFFVRLRVMYGFKGKYLLRMMRLEDRIHDIMNSRTQHIQCPYHMFAEPQPKYFVCKNCKWFQCTNDKCYVCNEECVLTHINLNRMYTRLSGWKK